MPNHFRDELERSIVRSLRSAQCFVEADRHDPETAGSIDSALVLVVHLRAFEEHSTYDIPIAALDAPDLPPDAQNQVVVRMQLDVIAELQTVDATPVRDKRFGLSAAHRPLMREDPRYAARDALLTDAATNVTRFACKGSAKKLTRDIERARAAHADR